jgi:hypothetical protein
MASAKLAVLQYEVGAERPWIGSVADACVGPWLGLGSPTT